MAVGKSHSGLGEVEAIRRAPELESDPWPKAPTHSIVEGHQTRRLETEVMGCRQDLMAVAGAERVPDAIGIMSVLFGTAVIVDPLAIKLGQKPVVADEPLVDQ
jgi:hypothetical protein